MTVGAPTYAGCMSATSGTPKRPWYAQVLGFLGTLAAVISVGFFGLAFAVMPVTDDIPAVELLMRMMGSLAALASGISMFWRMKYPTRVLLVTAGLTLIFPLDPLGPTLAFSWVVAKGRRKDLYWAFPLAAAATAASLFRDWMAPDVGTVMASHLTDSISVMTPLGYAAMWVLGLGLAFAVGWARRSWGLVEQATSVAQEKQERVQELEGELSRQEERDLIAREMHDTVAHHLSLVSLHAGALEVTSEDPNVPEASKAMRRSAHQALEEMRTLIHSLRDSESEGYAQASLSLSSLPALVRDARAAGAPVNAVFTVEGEQVLQDPDGSEGADGADGALASLVAAPVDRAAYRIVQEALTNALKHAPGQPVDVWVDVNGGVRLLVSNPVGGSGAQGDVSASGEPKPPRSAGAGAGVVGIWERVATLGGNAEVGLRDGRWVVEAWLPKQGA